MGGSDYEVTPSSVKAESRVEVQTQWATCLKSTEIYPNGSITLSRFQLDNTHRLITLTLAGLSA